MYVKNHVDLLAAICQEHAALFMISVITIMKFFFCILILSVFKEMPFLNIPSNNSHMLVLHNHKLISFDSEHNFANQYPTFVLMWRYPGHGAVFLSIMKSGTLDVLLSQVCILMHFWRCPYGFVSFSFKLPRNMNLNQTKEESTCWEEVFKGKLG